MPSLPRSAGRAAVRPGHAGIELPSGQIADPLSHGSRRCRNAQCHTRIVPAPAIQDSVPARWHPAHQAARMQLRLDTRPRSLRRHLRCRRCSRSPATEESGGHICQPRDRCGRRAGWVKGYMQTYLVHMRPPVEFFQKRRLHGLFSFQVVIGSAIGVIFINPLMWLLLGAYVVFGHSVIEIYHRLFPGPVLYLGAFCLIFGNFFYVYLYLLACMKRKQYHLLPWTLFIPLYWLLMSVAGLYALFELLVNPHYWQKTVHGLHLKGKQAQPVPTTQMTIEEPTMPMPIMPGKVSKVGAVSTVPMSLKAIPTLLMPAGSPKQKQAEHVARRSKVRDLCLVATIIIPRVTSLVACWYYFQQHEILLYDDAYSHLRIARSVFDNITPGIAQLGTVWLPLPHILLCPFIWNDYLWHSGLAGSFVSMPCYVIAAIYLFLSARRLTGNSGASFIVTLAFIFNPIILYLKTTLLRQKVYIATYMMLGYN